MSSLVFQPLICASCFGCAFCVARLALMRASMLSSAHQVMSLEDILGDRLLCLVLLGAISFVISYATTPWLLAPCLLCSTMLARRAPRILENQRARELRCTCDEQVDTMADIVSMGVRSGLSFDAALDLYCSKFDNTLSRLMAQAQAEWKTGLLSRREALVTLSKSVRSNALRRFSETCLQAIQHGAPLSSMLDTFSRDIRQRKQEAIERQVAKAPVKMLIPTGTCMLPAMLILVLGPVLLQFFQSS